MLNLSEPLAPDVDRQGEENFTTAGDVDSIKAEVMYQSLPDWCVADPPSVHVRLALVRH